MGYEITLPKDTKAKESALAYMLDVGKNARRQFETTWWVCHYYLSGARDFELIDYLTGAVKVSYANTSTLDFKYEDIMAKFQSQFGRLMQIDLSPKVSRRSKGLEDVKKASVGQIALDYAFGPEKVKKLKQKMMPLLLKTGTVGLVTYAIGESIGVDVVPPWELLPIPANNIYEGEVSGHARIRTVPLEWVQNLEGVPAKGSSLWTEMETTSVPRGTISSTGDALNSTFLTTATVPTQTGGEEIPDSHKSKGMKKKGKINSTSTEVVEIAEIWLENTEGYLSNYILMAGKKVVIDRTFEEVNLSMPISVAKDYDIGNYWGRSYVEILLPMNNEMEYTLGRTFQNLQDMDAYGILLLPASLGANLEALRGSDGIKKMVYEPDYLDPSNSKIDNITPANTGLMPIRALETAKSIADDIAGIPEMLSGGAPGRVDSASGLGLLNETANIPLTPVATSIATAISQCYRSMLDIMRMTWPENKVIDMSVLDDTLVGVKMDSSTGQVAIDTENIPAPDEVILGVKASMPRSKEQEKLELQNMLSGGLITPMEFRIESRRKGLELPVANEIEWQNYRRAKMNNIILFGDGKTPGGIITSKYDMPEVHAKVLAEFMARPEYYLATPEVRNAFAEAYEFYVSGMGQLPEGVPYLEDLALEQEEASRQQAQGAGQMPPMGQPMQ